MKIRATVVWTIGVEVKVSDNATIEQKRKAIHKEALKAKIDFQNPIICSCSDKDCID